MVGTPDRDVHNRETTRSIVRSDIQRILYRTSRRRTRRFLSAQRAKTTHHPSEFELIIELVEFFIDVLSPPRLAAPPSNPQGEVTGAALGFTVVALRITVRGWGWYGQFVIVLSLPPLAAPPANPEGEVTGEALGSTVEALRIAVQGGR